MFRNLLIAFMAILSISCVKPELQTYKKTSTIMYTYVSITVSAESPKKADSAIEAAFDEIRKLERLLSFWTEDSEIALINRHAGERPVKVSPETMEIVKHSLYIAEQTGGAFDPTVGPVIKLWDFKKQLRPDNRRIADALPLVNYRMVEVNDEAGTVFLKDASMSFDTGGIAKGYAADRAVEVLKNNGIFSGIVAVAGDIRVFGKRLNGEPWRLGIRHPRAADDSEALLAKVSLEDMAISTSGDYERFFIKDGVRYHHILDPKTGYPAANGSVSVTVIAPKAVYTDGFSTGIFVMGPEEGIRLLERLGFDGVIVDSDGNKHVTLGLRGHIEWTEPEPSVRTSESL